MRYGRWTGLLCVLGLAAGTSALAAAELPMVDDRAVVAYVNDEPVFLDEVLTIADGFYAVVAASFAAFLANRRLSREQFYALRLWRTQSDGHQ